MEIKAKIAYARMSPKKLGLLTVGMKGISPRKALEKLQFYPQKGKNLLIKLIKQAIANAVNNFKLSEDNLEIKRIEIGEGPRIKRMDKSHGARFDRGIIKKKNSKLLLVLTEREHGTKN